MSLLGIDPEYLRAIAHRISRHADAARGTARHLRAAVASTRWHGVAGSAFRREAGQTIDAIFGAAGGLDDSAAALRRLAAALEALIDDAVRLARDASEFARDVGELAVDALGRPAHLLGDVEGVGADVLGTAGDIASGLADVLGL